MYAIKEIYMTVQGEGARTGWPAVFLRFSGCNLWTGREQDRARAVCRFCDTDFWGTDGAGGGKYASADHVAAAVAGLWPLGDWMHRYVVCTGGEPLLQLDESLIAALHERGFMVAIETNGTLPAPLALDWVCVSPKSGAPLVQQCGDELKLVYPQEGGDPAHFEQYAFAQFSLQPMDGARLKENTQAAIAYCLAHPRWRLSLQTHKFVGVP